MRARPARSPARQQWERELRAHVDGQDRFRPSTWRLDALWRAACVEAQAAEWDAIHAATADELRDRADEIVVAAMIEKTERAA